MLPPLDARAGLLDVKAGLIDAGSTNIVVWQQARWSQRHVVHLERRVRHRRGPAKAVGAVARHLAGASFWILTRNEDYLEPASAEPCQTDSSATAA
ncbi:MAG: hypothetical protein KGJ60_16305 [Verrucomicrobiota bacterium]|nr:hypothetical protein [Verrucomicrobiota bacterium]